jgi:hypothetical protein
VGLASPRDGFNFDVRDLPGVDLRGDIRKGLPLADASVDCVAAIHALRTSLG